MKQACHLLYRDTGTRLCGTLLLWEIAAWNIHRLARGEVEGRHTSVDKRSIPGYTS